jgi:hypothetical protein
MKSVFFTLAPFAPLRGQAADSAEMVSQLLFGDLVHLLEEDRQWRRVRNLSDGYEGWVDQKAIVPVEQDWIDGIIAWDFVVEDSLKLSMRFPGGEDVLRLGLGAKLPKFNSETQSNLRIGDFQIALDAISNSSLAKSSDWLVSSAKYLGTPYLWGGKTLGGIDCSGLTQIVFAMQGIQLPRDAAQQIAYGAEVEFSNRHAGDLAFFANQAGKITHVGIVLDGNEIRHASGTVHDDWLNEFGIQHKYTGKQTHSLVSIKRII